MTIPEGCDPAGYAAELIANATLDSDGSCAAADTALATVICDEPSVDVVKETSPQTTSSGSTVTITVTNDGPVILDPVQVMEHLPAGLNFDETQEIMGTCGAAVSHRRHRAGRDVGHVHGLLPGSGQSLHHLLRGGLRGLHRRGPDRHRLRRGLCDGTFPDGESVSASDTALVRCVEGEACPRTIGFWRQQCAQRGNGSTKGCEEGMYTLWDCVLGATGVTDGR